MFRVTLFSPSLAATLNTYCLAELTPLYYERFLFFRTVGVKVMLVIIFLSANTACNCAGILGVQSSIVLPNEIF
jgi:hypothetical protein